MKKNLIRNRRFVYDPSCILEAMNASIDVDKRMYKQEIEASIAHCKMLKNQQIIDSKVSEIIIAGLLEIEKEIEDGSFEFSYDLEDIHMNVEFRLTEKIGSDAGRLHTARSRNDQVVTVFKMWIKDNIQKVISNLICLMSKILDFAQEHVESIMAGLTHSQIAQPITLGHHFMAYFHMLARDAIRFQDDLRAMNYCPLGSCALAGTSFNVDRHYVARELNFLGPTANSIDSVSDRDYAIDVLNSMAICAVHLSRMSEDMIMWMGPGFGFLTLSDAVLTGSSIMPQKANPDLLELIRAYAGIAIGNVTSMLALMKALPMSYNKDMQEDKKIVFDACDKMVLCIQTMQELVSCSKINVEKMKSFAYAGHSTATELADWLVKSKDITFREAHKIVGKLVAMAERLGIALHQLSIEDMQSVSPLIDKKVYAVLDPIESVNRKCSYGGTAPASVMNAILDGRALLESLESENR